MPSLLKLVAGHMWVHSESTARTVNKQITRRCVLLQNLITRLGSQSAFVNFGVHGSIVLYRISWYTESYYKGFLLYFRTDLAMGT